MPSTEAYRGQLVAHINVIIDGWGYYLMNFDVL